MEELLPSTEHHIKNRNYNKKNLSKMILQPSEEEEEKTVDERIQELIQKKLINKSVTPTKEFKYQKLVLSQDKKD